MRYGSVCSGIEAASVAWHPLGWRASFLSEIEAFPRAVLSHHYPETPLHGDFTTIKAGEYAPIDLLVGGTPCQSFSVAGLRGGLADERGNLALEYLRLAQRLRPRWLVWENVPGVLSSAGGRDFGAILGGLVELGYGFAYRVLDAQYIRVDGFGRAVPQRRRRVFVVGHLGDWRRAAAVLLERESLRGNTPPRREPRQGIAYDVAPCIAASGRGFERTGDTRGQDCLIPDVSLCLNAGGMGRTDYETETMLPVAYGLSTQQEPKWAENLSPTLAMPSKSGGGQVTAVAFAPDVTATMVGRSSRGGGQTNSPGHNADETLVAYGWRVRRLTPTECEALQGFPRNYTNIPYRGKPGAPDGPRYKALGNSMAVNCMAWIGRRIEMVDRMETVKALEDAA
jgi:DNA (cytosine-5)-methyltransferase 1